MEYRVVTWAAMRWGLLGGWLVFSGRVCKGVDGEWGVGELEHLS